MDNKKIIEIREKIGLTKKEFAALIGVPYENLCRWEKGSRKPSKVYEKLIYDVIGRKAHIGNEQHWILTSANIKHIKNIIHSDKRPFFGVVNALRDADKKYFIMEISVIQDAHRVEDLKKYFHEKHTSEGKLHYNLVGCFFAGNSKKYPPDNVKRLMKDGLISNAGYCVMLNRDNDEITLWEHCGVPTNLNSEFVKLIQYIIVS